MNDMENPVLISWINDFVFCPASIYFHNLYGNIERILYQDEAQLDGTAAHKAIDENRYSTRRDILQGIECHSVKYNLSGKIDTFDMKSGVLTERKKKIKTVYDGYVFQLYAQYFCLEEMTFRVNKIRLYSMDDNKVYNIPLPHEDKEMFEKFEKVIAEMNGFRLDGFSQDNGQKCAKCIYEPLCDRSAST